MISFSTESSYPGGDLSEGFSEEKMGGELSTSLKDAQHYRKDYDLKLDKWWNDFRDIKPVRLLPFFGCANWSTPVTSTSILATVPRLLEGMFGFDPPVIHKPVNMQAAQTLETYKKFMRWFYAINDYEGSAFYGLFLNTVWSGTGFAYVYMDMEKSHKDVSHEFEGYVFAGTKDPVMDPSNPQAIMKVTPENTALFESPPPDPKTGQPNPPLEYEIHVFRSKRKVWRRYEPKVRIIETKDIYFPAHCRDIKDAWENDWIYIREYITKDYLRRMIKQDAKKMFKNLDKFKIEGLETNLNLLDEQESTEKNHLIEYAEKTNKVEVWRCLGNYDVDGDGINEKVVVLMAKDGTVYGWDLYPYKHRRCPVVDAKILPLPNKPFGIGIPERMYDTKGFLDDFYSSVTDRIRYQNDPPVMYTTRSGYDPFTCLKGYGRNWEMNNIGTEDIKPFELPKSEFNTFQLIQSFQQWGDRIANVDARSLGVEDPNAKNITKGGIEAVINEGNILFRQYIKNLVPCVKEVYFQIGALLQQYWGEEADIEINERVRQIMDNPENPLRAQLQSDTYEATGVGPYDVIAQGYNVDIVAGAKDKETEVNKAFQTYEIMKAEPLYESDPERKIAALKHIFKMIGYSDDEATEIIPNMEAINQRQVAIQKQAQAELLDEQNKAEGEAEGEREVLSGRAGI